MKWCDNETHDEIIIIETKLSVTRVIIAERIINARCLSEGFLKYDCIISFFWTLKIISNHNIYFFAPDRQPKMPKDSLRTIILLLFLYFINPIVPVKDKIKTLLILCIIHATFSFYWDRQDTEKPEDRVYFWI